MAEEEEAWPVKGIVAENPVKRLYKIEWDGIDPETKRPWDATWEPFDCVSSQLRAEWDERKAARQERDVRKEAKRKLMEMDINRQQREADRSQDLDGERQSSRSRSRSKSGSANVSESRRRRVPSASSDDSMPLRPPQRRLIVHNSNSPDPEDRPPVQAGRKRKRASHGGSDPSYKPTQTTHTQSTENTRDTLYDSNISSNSVNALKSTQEPAVMKKGRRKSAPVGGDASATNGKGKAPRRSLPATGQEADEADQEEEEDFTWPDDQAPHQDPRETKKKLRKGVQTTNQRGSVPVKAKRRRRESPPSEGYWLPANLQEPQERVEPDEEGGDPADMAISQEVPHDMQEEELAVAEPEAEPETEEEDATQDVAYAQEKRILQSLARRSSDSEGDGQLIVTSGAQRPTRMSVGPSNGPPQLPESLRYNGPSRSEYIDDTRPSGAVMERSGSDSLHQSAEAGEEAEPSGRTAAKGKGKAKAAFKAKKAKQGRPSRSEPSDSSGLPNFRRRHPDSVEAEPEEVIGIRGASRRSYDPLEGEDQDGWPVDIDKPGPSHSVPAVENEDNETHVVPDSQSLQRQGALDAYDPQNAALTSARDPPTRATSAGANGRRRRSAGPAGSKLAAAAVEKPLKKVQPPEPGVFKPYIRDRQDPSQPETIQAFSSQGGQQASTSRGAVREAIQQAAASRRASVKRGQFPPRQEEDADVGSVEERATPYADNQVEEAYSQFQSIMGGWVPETAPLEAVAAEQDEQPDVFAEQDMQMSYELPPMSEPIAPLQDKSAPIEKEAQQPPAAPEVVERKATAKELRKYVKASALPSDTKDELAILLEAPDYYKISGRALTSQPQWTFKLGAIPEEETPGELVLELNMELPSWILQEHRAAKAPEIVLEGDSAMQALRAEVAALKARVATSQSTIESQTMQIALLSSEVNEKASLYARAILAVEVHESEKAVLRKENAELKSQLTAGLAQIRLIEGAARDKLRSEYERMQAELKTAHEMARLTGDHVIRAKAARADELERLERERLATERRLREAALARRQAEAAAAMQARQMQLQQQMEQPAAPVAGAFVNAAMGDASSDDEDGNFEGGSSGSGSEEDTDSDDEEDARAIAMAQLAALEQTGVLLPPELAVASAPNAAHLAVPPTNVAAAIEQGVIPGGLAAISPALSPQPSADAGLDVSEAAALLAAVDADGDTSGETTEQTTTNTGTGTDSQKLLNTSSEMSAGQVLVMDSEELPTGKTFACRWGADKVDACKVGCKSRQDLDRHIEKHIYDLEARRIEANAQAARLLSAGTAD